MKRVAFLALAAAAVGIAWWAMRGEGRPRAIESAAPAPAREAPADPIAPAEVRLPPPGRSALEAPAPELVESSEPRPSVASAAPATILLHGFVRAAEGSELPEGVSVSRTDRLGRVERAPAGPDGAYAFGGLAPGTYWLSAGSLREGRAEARVELDASEPERRLDLELEPPAALCIRVVDRDGRPAGGPDLLAVATLEPPGEWLREVHGALNNRFGVGHYYASDHFPGLASDGGGCLGKLFLLAEPPVHVSLVNYQRVLATRRVEPGAREVEFVVDPAQVAGTEVRFHFVDAETGERLEASSARLVGSNGRLVFPVDGGFRVPDVAPGWWEIQGRVSGYDYERHGVLVEARELHELGGIPLERSVWITGTISDERGQGVSTRMNVALFDDETGWPVRHRGSRSVRSKGDGSFEVYWLVRGTYYLSGDGDGEPWGRFGRRVDLRGGSVEGLRIELARGVPLAVRPSVDAAAVVRYRVLDELGELVTSGRLTSEVPRPVLLAPGTYTVEARVGEAEWSARAVTLRADPVELALP